MLIRTCVRNVLSLDVRGGGHNDGVRGATRACVCPRYSKSDRRRRWPEQLLSAAAPLMSVRPAVQSGSSPFCAGFLKIRCARVTDFSLARCLSSSDRFSDVTSVAAQCSVVTCVFSYYNVPPTTQARYRVLSNYGCSHIFPIEIEINSFVNIIYIYAHTYIFFFIKQSIDGYTLRIMPNVNNLDEWNRLHMV